MNNCNQCGKRPTTTVSLSVSQDEWDFRTGCIPCGNSVFMTCAIDFPDTHLLGACHAKWDNQNKPKGKKPMADFTVMMKRYFDAKCNVLISGSVGIGKTARIEQLAKDMDRKLITIILSLLDPTDIKGIPVITDGKLIWMTPDMWPTDNDPDCMILFDEIDRAGMGQVNAILTLLYGGTLGEYSLPKTALLCGACNGSSDTGTKLLSHAANNRFCHIDVTPDNTEVSNYLSGINADPRLISYVDKTHDLFGGDIERGQKAFPTPRSIEMVNDILPFTPENETFQTMRGVIGDAHAADLTAYFELADMITDIGQIIADPLGAQIPYTIDAEYFQTGSLSNAVKGDVTLFADLAKYASRLSTECCIVFMDRCVSDNEMLKETKTFTDYQLANKEVYNVSY